MKRNYISIKLLLSMILLSVFSSVHAQFGVVEEEDQKRMECVTEAQYQEHIRPLLEQKISTLTAQGKINFDPAKMGGAVHFSWPLRMSDEYAATSGVYSYWYITNFADLNHVEDDDESERLDWMCFEGTAAKNYDQHNGADIAPYPYKWQMQDDASVEVIAAADGEVIYIEDGYFDRNCATPHILGAGADFNGGYYGNFVALLHSDLSITVYAHLKDGSVANLIAGDFVNSGDYLGAMASSGNSSGPHLHFEYRPTTFSQYEEPWFEVGGCNDDVTESLWIDQIPYYEPQVLRVSTHDVTPVTKSCSDYEAGSNEDVNFSNHFTAFSTVQIRVAMRDYRIGDDLDVDILNSSGIVIASNFHVAAANYEATSILFTQSTIGYATGTYRIRVTHEGKTYDHYFTVNCPSALTLSGAQSGHKAYISGENINSTATISGVSTNEIRYEGETHVKLNVGFKATANCEFSAKVDDCTIGGLKEIEEDPVIMENNVNVFPNPSLGTFTVYFKSEELTDAKIIIRNLLGNIIYTSEMFSNVNEVNKVINLNNLSKGIYLVELQKPSGNLTQQVVIQ